MSSEAVEETKKNKMLKTRRWLGLGPGKKAIGKVPRPVDLDFKISKSSAATVCGKKNSNTIIPDFLRRDYTRPIRSRFQFRP